MTKQTPDTREALARALYTHHHADPVTPALGWRWLNQVARSPWLTKADALIEVLAGQGHDLVLVPVVVKAPQVSVGVAALLAVAKDADERSAAEPSHWGAAPRTGAWLRAYAVEYGSGPIEDPHTPEREHAAEAILAAAHEAGRQWEAWGADSGLRPRTKEWLGRVCAVARRGGLEIDTSVALEVVGPHS